MEGPGDYPIYLLGPSTGKMTGRITGDLSGFTVRLVFSADGRYLAAMLGAGGLRVFDRDKNSSVAFRDADYGAASFGAAFADDGRLATSSYDGKIRLYDRSFTLATAPRAAPNGHIPKGLAFSPDGNMLALGYTDTPLVELLDGHSLTRLPGPNTDDLKNGSLSSVAWSVDGQSLFAAGQYLDDDGNVPVLFWDQAAHGKRRAMSTCGAVYETLLSLVPSPAGGLLVVMADPCLTLLEPDGSTRWIRRRPGADFRGQNRSFAVSPDGTIIDFDFELFGNSPLRFDLRARALSGNRPADEVSRPPQQDGVSIESWEDSKHPKLNGKPIELGQLDISRSFALHPDGYRFVLGTS